MLDETKKQRIDGQLTGLAGEFFVAAELLKRGLQVSVTLGNAKQIDLLAHDPRTGSNFTIQVKALSKLNYFPIRADRIDRNHVYVFVLLNKIGINPTYFCVRGSVLHDTKERFGKSFVDPKFPCIHPRALADFENWKAFEPA